MSDRQAKEEGVGVRVRGDAIHEGCVWEGREEEEGGSGLKLHTL